MSLDTIGLKEVHLIESIHLALGHDERLLEFFFHHKHPRLRRSEEELLTEAQEELSPSDWILVKGALDIWNGKGGTTLNEIIRILDDGPLIQLLESILYFRETGMELEETC